MAAKITPVSANATAAPKYPYSQAIVVDDKHVYLSGMIGQTAAGVVVDGFEAQVHQIFDNMQSILKAAGSDLNHVVKVNVYLKTMDDFPKLNEIYMKHFSTHKPARTTVAVAGLPVKSLVEIECVAVVAPRSKL